MSEHFPHVHDDERLSLWLLTLVFNILASMAFKGVQISRRWLTRGRLPKATSVVGFHMYHGVGNISRNYDMDLRWIHLYLSMGPKIRRRPQKPPLRRPLLLHSILEQLLDITNGRMTCFETG